MSLRDLAEKAQKIPRDRFPRQEDCAGHMSGEFQIFALREAEKRRREMAEAFDDIYWEMRELEPRDQWTTSVVYWCDDTLQVITQRGRSWGPFGRTLVEMAITRGPQEPRTFREHLEKLRRREFTDGPEFPPGARLDMLRYRIVRRLIRSMSKWTGLEESLIMEMHGIREVE